MEDQGVPGLFIPEDVGIIGRLFQATTEMVSRYLRENNDDFYLENKKKQRLVRMLQSLLLWGEDNKVADGRLDAVLQRSKNLQAVTLTSLHCFAETFLDGALSL